jgi:ribosomal protein S12 methylthiotransferase accessory factor
VDSGIWLNDCFKTYTLDQDKAVSPEETVSSVKTRLAQTGLDVIQNTERIDNGRLGIPVYVSVCGPDALRIMPTRKQMGKGATPAQAEASAVMEMVERFSFFHFLQNGNFIRAKYEQVRDQAMPFKHIAMAVHHDLDDLDRAEKAFAELELAWVPGRNLTRDEDVLVPLSWFYEINEFNGSSAGNRMEEAIVQGLCEVVERHVSAEVTRNKTTTPRLDLESLENPAARELVEKYHNLGVQLHVRDFTLDMGVPTVAALAYDPSTFPEHSEIVYTAGTATHPEKALIRALTEVAQLGGDFNTRSNFLPSGLPKFRQLDQADYVIAENNAVTINDLPNLNHDNIRTEIERIVESLARRGYEAYAVNITHGLLGVPAVYTMVPGAKFRERAVGSSVPFFVAKLLAAQDNPTRVQTAMDRLDALYPGSHFIRFHQGLAMIEQGRPAEAVAILETAADMNPPDEDLAGILTYMGMALKDIEEYDRAITVLRQSAGVDEDRQDTYNLLGFCYFKTRQHEKAIEAFREVLRLDPGSAVDYANIGSNYRELGQPDKAAEYYRTALELDPSLDWVRDNLAKLA